MCKPFTKFYFSRSTHKTDGNRKLILPSDKAQENPFKVLKYLSWRRSRQNPTYYLKRNRGFITYFAASSHLNVEKFLIIKISFYCRFLLSLLDFGKQGLHLLIFIFKVWFINYIHTFYVVTITYRNENILYNDYLKTDIFIYLEQSLWLQRYNETLIYVWSSIFKIFCLKVVIC